MRAKKMMGVFAMQWDSCFICCVISMDSMVLCTVMVMSQQWGIELEQGLVLPDHKRSPAPFYQPIVISKSGIVRMYVCNVGV